MDEQQKAEMIQLAGVVHERRQRLLGLGMMNVNGRTPESALQLSQEYAIAQAELMRAESDLRAAQVRYSST